MLPKEMAIWLCLFDLALLRIIDIMLKEGRPWLNERVYMLISI